MISGKKEVTDAVLIAALSALFTGVIDKVLQKIFPEEEEKKDKCVTCQK